MTPSQQRRAITLLKMALALKEQFEEGNGVSSHIDDKHTSDVRKLLIEMAAIPDRRKISVKKYAKPTTKGIES